MPLRTAEINIKPLQASLERLARNMVPAFFDDGIRRLAWWVIGEAINSPVPSESGILRNTGTVERIRPGVVRLGFNKEYASFQDQPSRRPGSVIRITPKVKRILYIPLTPRGRKHIYGANPRAEGLERGIDFVLKDEVKIKVKAYHSAVGPNKYFSQTMKVVTPDVRAGITQLMNESIGKATKGAKTFVASPKSKAAALLRQATKYTAPLRRPRYTGKGGLG